MVSILHRKYSLVKFFFIPLLNNKTTSYGLPESIYCYILHRGQWTKSTHMYRLIGVEQPRSAYAEETVIDKALGLRVGALSIYN